MAGLAPLGGIGAALQNLTLGNIARTAATSVVTSTLGNVARAASVDRVADRRSQDQQVRQLQERQRLDQERLAQSNASDRARQAQETADAERKRRDALRRAVSRSNASFAGRGISAAGGGSADAVLLGLFEESDAEKQDRERLDNIRTTALDQRETQLSNRNLLEVNQLRDQQRLQNRIF